MRTSSFGDALKRRFQSWPVYAAVTGAAAATATNASASIIYSGVMDVTAAVASHLVSAHAASRKEIVLKNISGNSVAHFSIGVSHDSYPRFKVGVADLYGDGEVNFLLKSGFAKHLSSGARISGVAGFATGSHGVAEKYQGSHGFHQTYGWAKSGKTMGFVGFAFKTAGHKTDYGWVRLQLSIGTNGFLDGITAIDWAYQPNGNPIQAGDKGPEPSTMALMLLSAGAAGVCALRRRRKAAQGRPELV